MKNISRRKITLACLIALSGYATYRLFDTRFVKITIDYLAFSAGIFLMVEGLYKISRSKVAISADQFLRGFRVMIGGWIFLIHLSQFMKYRVFSRQIAEITIDYKDYFAFFMGIFLLAESLYKISASKAPLFPAQFPRILRAVIGTCLITIHIVQFMSKIGF